MSAHTHVLMTADTVGGVWTYAIELATALRPLGFSVSLATMGQPLSPAQWAEARAVPGLAVFESSYALEWMDEPWEDVHAAGEWLQELARDLKPGLIHLNGYSHATLHWPAPVIVVAHSCVLSWWRAVKHTSAPAEWDRYRGCVRSGLAGADLVIAPSQAMLRTLEANYGPVPASRVIYNGRTPPARTGVPKEPFILSVGRLWDPAKNLASLALIAEDLPWPVFAAGDCLFANNDAGASPNGIRRLGRLSAAELWPWFERAAIYALPARYEPFGLSILEAALSGCALVLGDIPSLREIWGDAALYVPPERPTTLRDALGRLATDATLRGRLADRARHRAARYCVSRMAAQYADAYGWCAQKFLNRPGSEVVACA